MTAAAVPHHAVRRRMADHIPPIEVIKKPGKSKNKKPTNSKNRKGRRIVRALLRSYLPRSFFNECKNATSGLPAGKITVAEAMPILGLSKNGVHSLIHRKILHGYPEILLSPTGHRCRTLVLSRKEVEDHRDAQAAKYGPSAERARLEKALAMLREILSDGQWHSRLQVVEHKQRASFPQVIQQEAQASVEACRRVGERLWCEHLQAVLQQRFAGGGIAQRAPEHHFEVLGHLVHQGDCQRRLADAAQAQHAHHPTALLHHPLA